MSHVVEAVQRSFRRLDAEQETHCVRCGQKAVEIDGKWEHAPTTKVATENTRLRPVVPTAHLNALDSNMQFPTPRGVLAHQHRHKTTAKPPVRCDDCGEAWTHVVDGRSGRRRRTAQGRLFSGAAIIQTRDDRRSWSLSPEDSE